MNPQRIDTHHHFFSAWLHGDGWAVALEGSGWLRHCFPRLVGRRFPRDDGSLRHSGRSRVNSLARSL